MVQTGTPLAERIEDEFRFFKTWAQRPLKMGAVSPSSRAFARMMIKHGRPDPEGWTLELGPGTGVITEELIRSGIPQERLVCVEFEQHFYELLKKRFPRVNLIRGDAFDLQNTLGEFADTKFSAVLSGVPVLLIPEEKRRRFIEDCLSRVRPGGNLTQLSYSFTSPQKSVPGSFTVEKSPWVAFNLPPGRVWIFEKEAA
ncbi:phosphatidylethanolamine/phosphatidyl-N-methylethanolamine N-methyltransferase [Afifella marina DSM 2698]|uniref:Phosphatidylethanolamine/phosphatidyl-N-methylethanolamine N-methyltransferase n=2 Tax=Afifella marina TaxID=1080 RepID=A0A1G5NEI6_AFIMA|nr:phosphatidylethanolamine/phosphatidyl-N-methylethanolamine N-methyltransferase [Afifella marina DSM 2698]